MSDTSNRNEREALIAEGHDGALDADEAADLELLADLLADPSTWAEPPAGLDDEVVRAVTGSAADRETSELGAKRRDRARRRRWIAIPAAAAVAASVALAFGVVSGGGTHPEFVADMHATPLAPAASATADVTHNPAGFHVTLDAHGLPHLGAGQYFQAWLKNAAGIGVPIGTFSSSDHTVTLWSGVSPAAFPKITVTIEKTDGDQRSSGLVVLSGDVQHR